ncbi:MAG: hypothetical protein SGILL_009557 [Bacillariaceae sp.]
MKLASFERELDAVLKLDDSSSSSNGSVTSSANGSIVFFEDWFTGPNFACIVMMYADGGSLAEEIVRKASSPTGVEPYTERRIGFYMLQLIQALTFAHQRGVAHMDVKSANILIHKGGKNGHQLVLTDWGSACTLDDVFGTGIRGGATTSSPIESMTELYASPEFQNAYNQRNFTGLQPIAIDSFALGCILYELLCCKKMVDFLEDNDETLGEFIGKHNSADAALHSTSLRLPFQRNDDNQGPHYYSTTLREMLGSLLDSNPATRKTPAELLRPLQTHHASPILAGHVAAAHPLVAGAPVTIDNVQLGMFVQRGHNWSEGGMDGGPGSIGVVTRLDPDCAYTEVTFNYKPPFSFQPSPILSRIGAGNKLELRVGPTSINDMSRGMLPLNGQTASLRPGENTSNGKFKVVAVTDQHVFVVPTEKRSVPPLGLPDSASMFHQIAPVSHFVAPAPLVLSNASIKMPKTWQGQSEANSTGAVRLVDVTNGVERSKIVNEFFSINLGLDIQEYEISSIKRVQSTSMWTEYMNCRDSIVGENFGISNEQRLFHGTNAQDPLVLLSSNSISLASFNRHAAGFGSQTIQLSSRAQFGDNRAYKAPIGGIRRMVLSRVELGRTKDSFWSQNRSDNFHSVKSPGSTEYHACEVLNPFQAYPEYIITYSRISSTPPTRRVVRPVNPRTPRGRSRVAATSRMPPRPLQPMSPGVASFAQPLQQTATAFTPPFTPPRRPSAGVSANATTPSSETPSKVKECVVCLERPVTHILVPCGHPCLCEVCATSQGLSRLRSKCPECRQGFHQAVRFYGKIVED